MSSTILLVLFILLVVLNNYLGLYISRMHGADISTWPDIIKSGDYTFYLIYGSYLALLFDTIASIIRETHVFPAVLLGLAFAFAGLCVNLVARRDLARGWSPLAAGVKEHGLVKSGIYSKIRHPIYLSNLFFSLGFALISWNLPALPLFILYLAALHARIRREEREMVATFGDEYIEYTKEVPSMIPGLRRR